MTTNTIGTNRINGHDTVSNVAASTTGWPTVTIATEVLPAGTVETDHQGWLAARTRGLGGSDVAAVVGAHPWHSPYEVWLDKTDRSQPRPDTWAMRRGRYFEPALCQWFSDQTGLATLRTGTWARNDAPWMMCNPDRFVGDGCGLEVKQPASEWAAQWIPGPADYAVVQALWGIAVTGLPGWYLAADVSQGTAVELPLWLLDAADHAERIQWLVDVADWWWHRYVVADRPPPVDGSDATTAALKRAFRWPVNLGHLVELPGLGAKVARRRELKQIIADATDELALVENWIRAGLEHDETGCENGVPLIAYRPCGTHPDDPGQPAYRALRGTKPSKPKTPRAPRVRRTP